MVLFVRVLFIKKAWNVVLESTINLSRRPNTKFDYQHQPAKGNKSRQNYQDKILNNGFNYQSINPIQSSVTFQIETIALQKKWLVST